MSKLQAHKALGMDAPLPRNPNPDDLPPYGDPLFDPQATTPRGCLFAAVAWLCDLDERWGCAVAALIVVAWIWGFSAITPPCEGRAACDGVAPAVASQGVR